MNENASLDIYLENISWSSYVFDGTSIVVTQNNWGWWKDVDTTVNVLDHHYNHVLYGNE